MIVYADNPAPFIDRMQFEKSTKGYTYIKSGEDVEFNKCYAFINKYDKIWEGTKINSCNNPYVKKKSGTSCGSAWLTNTDDDSINKSYKAHLGNYLEEYDAYFMVTFSYNGADNQVLRDDFIVDKPGESTM